jgi:cell division protein FtsL
MKKRLLLLTALVLVALAIGIGVSHFRDTSNANQAASRQRGVNTVDYSGPTKEEQAVGNAQKTKEVERSQLNNNPPQTSANLAIVDSTQYGSIFEVRAFISNIFENGGTCKVTLTKSGAPTISQTSAAAASATNTQCATIDIPTSNFSSKGEWQLTVSYNSATASGTSEQKTVSIK